MERWTIVKLREIAGRKGGECISTVYRGIHAKHEWRCGKAHPNWWATANSVIRGSWCDSCSHQRVGENKTLTLEGWQKRADERGLDLLSTEYLGAKNKIHVRCRRCSHNWQVQANSMLGGKNCPNCAGNIKLTIEHAHKLAAAKRGRCLSTIYKNARSSLIWECAKGHLWPACYDKVKQGTWCPECSGGIGERICRAYFEQLFSRPFPRARPTWLIAKNGNRFELDGFCPELGLAFEHQGEYHYSLKGYYTKTKIKLAERKAKDRRKAHLCRKNAVTLIAVGEIPTRQSIEDLKSLIKAHLFSAKIALPDGFDDKIINLSAAYANDQLEEQRVICAARGGFCLSTEYKNAKTKLTYLCGNGHKWDAVPDSVKRGTWCGACYRERRRSKPFAAESGRTGSTSSVSK
jgi:hypothetical protein